MIRQIIVPQASSYMLQFPPQVVGRKVEAIAFAVDEPLEQDALLTHLASEPVLSTDWLTPEEDAIWQDL